MLEARALAQALVNLPISYQFENRPLRLEVIRSERRVVLYRGDTMLKSSPIGVGRPGWETPMGEFHVNQILANPAWKYPFTG